MPLCNVTFSFVCSLRWSDLQGKDDPAVRYCARCDKEVHAVFREEQIEEHRERGHCVALKVELADDLVMEMGMLEEPSSIDRHYPRFDPILYRPIEELELPMAVSQALGAAHVGRVGDLVQMTEADFLAVKGLTRACLDATKEILGWRGLSLGVHLDGFPDEI